MSFVTFMIPYRSVGKVVVSFCGVVLCSSRMARMQY